MKRTIYLVSTRAVARNRCGFSSSSATFGTGSKSFTVGTGLDFNTTDTIYVHQENFEDRYMYGTVTSYNSGTGALTINVDGTVNAVGGTVSSWLIRQPKDLHFSMNDSYTSEPTDSPADTYWEDRVKDIIIDRAMYSSQGAIGGAANASTVIVTLVNGDGGLDDFAGYVFDGQPITVQRGVYRAPLADFVTVFSGFVEQVDVDDAGNDRRVSLIARCGLQLFIKRPLQPLKFAGTGSSGSGIEGGADVKNKPRPVWGGICRGVVPVLVDATLLIYQINYKALTAGYTIVGGYDGRAALSQGSDYSSYTDMITTGPSSGEFRIYNGSTGAFVRLGSTPVYDFTMDIEANCDFVTAPRILSLAAYLLNVDSSFGGKFTIDTSSSLYPNGSPEAGIWVSEEMDLMAAINQVLSGINGYIYARRTSPYTLRIDQLSAPSGSPALSLNDTILSVRRLQWGGADRGTPMYALHAKYRKNWNPVTSTALAGSASADERAFSTEEWRIESYYDYTVRAPFPFAREDSFETLIDAGGDATTEASRQFGLRHGTSRDVLMVESFLDDDAFTVDLHDVVQLTTASYGLEGGKLFRLIGYQIDAAADKFTGYLWG